MKPSKEHGIKRMILNKKYFEAIVAPTKFHALKFSAMFITVNLLRVPKLQRRFKGKCLSLH